MKKFIYDRQYNYYIVNHENHDYAEIYKNYNGTWVINYYFDMKDLGYSLLSYFETLKNAKNYLNSKFHELVK